MDKKLLLGKLFCKLSLGMLMCHCVYAAFPNQPESYSVSHSLSDALLYKASHEVSASIFYQQAFGDDLTIFDGTLLGYYATDRFYGFKAAAGMLLSAPFYVGKNGTHEDYEDAKQIFLFNTLYADYLDENLGLHVIGGRYKGKQEWISYYTQGFGITYTKIPHTELNFTASYGSALVLNEFVTNFRTDLNNSLGSYFLSGKIHLPHHVEIEPYVYVTGFFTAFGAKAMVGYEISRDLMMETKLQILGYSKRYASSFPVGTNHKFELAALAGLSNQNLSAIAWLEQEVKYDDFLEGKLGIIGVTSSGAELIDYMGQQTPFEYNVGMFFGSAFSVYGSAGFELNPDLEIEAAIRGSFLPSGNIFSFELKGEGSIDIWRNKGSYGSIGSSVKARYGISVIGVYNNSIAVNFYGGNSYTLIRGYFRVSI